MFNIFSFFTNFVRVFQVEEGVTTGSLAPVNTANIDNDYETDPASSNSTTQIRKRYEMIT